MPASWAHWLRVKLRTGGERACSTGWRWEPVAFSAAPSLPLLLLASSRTGRPDRVSWCTRAGNADRDHRVIAKRNNVPLTEPPRLRRRTILYDIELVNCMASPSCWHEKQGLHLNGIQLQCA